jgi:hypothetical protein
MISLLGGKGQAPIPEIEEPRPSPSMTSDQIDELKTKLAHVQRSLDANANRDAMERFEQIPENLWRRGGPQMILLRGYVYFLNADPDETETCDESIATLNELVRDHEAYTSSHPEIFYYLALCHDNTLHFDKAVKNIRAYVELTGKSEQHARLVLAQTKANLEGTLDGTKGTMPIDLPPDDPASPTTDGQGESPKENHIN